MKTMIIKGYEILYDDIDAPWIEQLKWNLSKDGYVRTTLTENDKQAVYHLHRMVMWAKKGTIVDHINGNKFDNRRDNLRIVTHQQNSLNRGPTAGRTLPKGVIFTKGKFQAGIAVHGKYVYIGHFSDPEEAAIAHDFFAYFLHGDFARTNEMINSAPSIKKYIHTPVRKNHNPKKIFMNKLREHLEAGNKYESFGEIIKVKQSLLQIWLRKRPEIKELVREFETQSNV